MNNKMFIGHVNFRALQPGQIDQIIKNNNNSHKHTKREREKTIDER